jgi:UDP-GlcNAc:undecaprenyl-phosphate/decaprenyl-phosphate GlcNAc-1-phosphate transferase|tara:strand:+ start:93 stop:1082 length:990 start_codon:yes stop_codon:yes gene_type:complete
MELINVIILSSVLNIFIYIAHDNLISIFNTYDYPDKIRKLHKKKTSLLGGLILLINCCFFYLINKLIFNNSLTDFNPNSFMLGCILIFLLGLYDDKFNLNANIKFILQILIISIVLLIDPNLKIELLYFSFVDSAFILNNLSFSFTVICILIFINALNMYDGINLQVGSYSVVIFITLIHYSTEYALLSALILSLVVFLILNKNSKIFLGDNGSNLLGFIISFIVINIANNNNATLSVENIFILMMLPGLELIRLFVYRLSKGRHPFSADKKHIHHLILNKEGFLKTIFLTKFYVISPIILMIFLKDYFLYIIVGYVLLYTLIIAKYEK